MRRVENWLLFFCFLMIIGGLIHIQNGELALIVLISDLIILVSAVRNHQSEEAWIRLPLVKVLLLVGVVLLVGSPIFRPDEGQSTLATAAEPVALANGQYTEMSLFLLIAMLLVGLSLPSWEKG